MATIDKIEKLRELMVSWRRDIHAHPELGFEENRTSDFVAEKLRSFGYQVTQGLAKTGVVGSLRVGNSSRSVGLRADLDALPMDEQNTFEYKSKNKGKMHACGHDGHTAMLLGAAKYLAETQRFDGVIHIIFQPAEEGLGGAKKMMEDGLFDKFQCDSIYALHNKPGLAAGKLSVKAGPLMAAGAFFDIDIIGKGAHAAKPESSIDPILVAAHVITALQSIVSRSLDPQQAAVISITKINSGEAYNVIPQVAKIGGTVRAFGDDLMETIEEKMEKMTKYITKSYGADYQMLFRKPFVSLVNNDREADFAYNVCQQIVGDENVSMDTMSMASEDFSFMLKAVPGCYINIGNGEGGCSVHNPEYDFNDDILTIGASYFSALVENRLSN